MKKMFLLLIALIALAVVAFAQQPTMVSLQGKVTDSVGNPVTNGNLRVTVSTSDSCTQNVVYDYTYNSLIQAGLFNILLGNDTQLNLTYNQDYYVCTYVNNILIPNIAGSNTTKFRGGQGQIEAPNLRGSTFTNGNYTFADNLTFGAGFFIKNDEDYLYRILRAPIKFKDMVDRTADENVTGNWNFSNPHTLLGDIPISDIGAGDWEFVAWYNYSDVNMVNVSNVTGANLLKIVFFINVNGGTGSNRNHFVMRVNNDSSAIYDGMGIYDNAYTNTYGNAHEMQISDFNVLQTNITFGEIILSQYQNSPIIASIRASGTGAYRGDPSQAAVFFNGIYRGSAHLSDLSFFTEDFTNTWVTNHVINGTILVYKHKYFRGY